MNVDISLICAKTTCYVFLCILHRGVFRALSNIYDGTFTVCNVSKYGVFSSPYFPAFGLNTERYEVSLHFQSECGKIRTRKTPYLDIFHAVFLWK